MKIGEFSKLKVLREHQDGAILYWDQTRNLLLPWEEQIGEVEVGEELVVYLTTDDEGTAVASMRLRDFLKHDSSLLRVDQKVDLLVIDETYLGFECIIDHQHKGILYHNEVFQALDYGSRLTGYVKKIRDDGKVDLISQPRGVRGTPALGQQILERIQANDGFLAVNDKSSPGEIHDLFGVSKKKFKMALGDLYKKRLIQFENDGVRALQTD